MTASSPLEQLAGRGQVRGADAVFSAAEQQARTVALMRVRRSDRHADRRGPRNGRRWVIAAAAVMLFVVAAGALTLGVGDRSQLVGTGPDDSVPTVTDDTVNDTVFMLPEPPSGYALELGAYAPELAVNQPSRHDPRYEGSLVVFQQLDPTGTSAVKVLAVAVTGAEQRTLLDDLPTDPAPGGGAHDQRIVSSDQVAVGSRAVATAHVSTAHVPGTFGEFDIARWTEPTGETIAVATRGLDAREVLATIAGVTVINHAPVIDPAVVPVGMVSIHAHPRQVPLNAIDGEMAAIYNSVDYSDQIQIGSVTGDWPPASQMLWWVDGSALDAPGGNTLRSPRVTYRAMNGGAVMLWSSAGITSGRADELLDEIRPMDAAPWRQRIARLQGSATTTIVPVSIGG